MIIPRVVSIHFLTLILHYFACDEIIMQVRCKSKYSKEWLNIAVCKSFLLGLQNRVPRVQVLLPLPKKTTDFALSFFCYSENPPLNVRTFSIVTDALFTVVPDTLKSERVIVTVYFHVPFSINPFSLTATFTDGET